MSSYEIRRIEKVLRNYRALRYEDPAAAMGIRVGRG